MSATTTLPPTHRALVQEVYAEHLVVKELPTPQPTMGAAVIKVEAASIISYSRRIYDGTRKYAYPTPFTPGSNAIARIAALPPDNTSLSIGQLILFDCTIRSRSDPSHVFLSGIHEGWTPGKKLMHDVFRNSAYAEYALVPLENCFPIPESMIQPTSSGGLGYSVADLNAINGMLVPYGGLIDIGIKTGDTVIVAPATGSFGGMAVHVALAMGAGKIIAMGRNEVRLKEMVREGEGRVVTVKMTGDCEQEIKAIKEAVGGRNGEKEGEADVFFDISPPAASESTHLKACIMSLKHGGRVSLMGGPMADVKLPYFKIMHWNMTIKGKWMYERADVGDLIKMVETGKLRLGEKKAVRCIAEYGLDEWEKALERAETDAAEGLVVFKP